MSKKVVPVVETVIVDRVVEVPVVQTVMVEREILVEKEVPVEVTVEKEVVVEREVTVVVEKEVVVIQERIVEVTAGPVCVANPPRRQLLQTPTPLRPSATPIVATPTPLRPTATPVVNEQSRIAFTSDRDGDFEIYVMNTDGNGVVQLTDDDADKPTAEFVTGRSPHRVRIRPRRCPGDLLDERGRKRSLTADGQLRNGLGPELVSGWTPHRVLILSRRRLRDLRGEFGRHRRQAAD